MKFEQSLLSDIFDANVRIENIFYMQLLTSCSSMPVPFWEIFDENPMVILSALGLKDKDLSDYSDLRNKDDLLEFLFDNSVSGVLLNVATPVMRDLSFNEDGEYTGCSIGWNWYSTDFVHADTIENALIKAKVWQKELFEGVVAAAKIAHDKEQAE